MTPLFICPLVCALASRASSHATDSTGACGGDAIAKASSMTILPIRVVVAVRDRVTAVHFLGARG